MSAHTVYTVSQIVQARVINLDNVNVNARLSSQKSLIQQDIPAQTNTEEQQDINTQEVTNQTKIPLNQNRTYSTMLQLISGALVGWTNYCDIFMASDMGDDHRSRAKTGENNITVPTLQEVARKVAHLEKTET